MEVVTKIACEKCGTHLAPKDMKVLPYKEPVAGPEKGMKKILWGCDKCQKELQEKMDKEK